MKLTRKKTSVLTIEGVKGLDPVTVVVDHWAPHAGNITIQCWGKVWFAGWGAMGKPLPEFFRGASEEYLVDNLLKGAHPAKTASERDADYAYLRRIVVAVRQAFAFEAVPAKRRAQLERVEHVNALVRIIAAHGRRFFWNDETEAMAAIELDARGRVWWIDDYRSARIYTHDDSGPWRGFSHGGTLRDLVIELRNYVLTGRLVNRYRIAPKRAMDGGHDMWGYGDEACAKVRAEAYKLPMFTPEPSPAA